MTIDTDQINILISVAEDNKENIKQNIKKIDYHSQLTPFIFLWSVINNNVEIYKNLLNNSYDINRKTPSKSHLKLPENINFYDIKKYIPRHYSDSGIIPLIVRFAYDYDKEPVIKDPFNKVKEMISYGADLNETDYYGDTALMHACMNEDSLLVEQLINLGADVNSKNYDGLTPIMFSGNKKIAELLVNNNADLTITNNQGNNALEHISSILDIEAFKVVYNEAKTKNMSIDLNEMFHEAAQSNNFSITEYLVSEGADPNSATDHNNNIWHTLASSLLVDMENKDFVKSIFTPFIQHTDNINDKNSFNETALELALKEDHLITAARLIYLGAEITNEINWTAAENEELLKEYNKLEKLSIEESLKDSYHKNKHKHRL